MAHQIPPYTAEISRATPAFFVFLLDQSFSMDEPIGGSETRKCDALVDTINGWINNMIIRAAAQGGIRDWMDVAVIGYTSGADDANDVRLGSCLPGELANSAWQPISALQAQPLRLKDSIQKIFDADAGEMIEMPVQVPVWIEPIILGATPMCTALEYTKQIVEQWINLDHQNCFPPIVIHITDGESSDGNPVEPASALKQLETSNGNLLLLNCHLSMLAADKIMFPHSIEVLPDPFARDLFEMSSVLPEPMFQRAVADGFPLQPGARGFVFNADMVSLLQFLDMGTRISKQLR
ncbi:MAG: von Willebrand factor type [Planctomycetaceae bacterium]|nr:von Willebrand factor type [Planctomycetaceae bacterium]